MHGCPWPPRCKVCGRFMRRDKSVEINEFVRAGGDVICEVCGKKYYDHPMDKEILSWGGYPFLNVGCDGTRLKL